MSFAFLMTAFDFDKSLKEFLAENDLISRESKMVVYIKPLETVRLLLSLKEEVDRLRETEQKYRSLQEERREPAQRPEAPEKPERLRPEEGFYFYRDMGDFTGLSALSLQEFRQRLKEVPLESIEFHSGRGDFENWLRSLGHAELADGFEVLRGEKVFGEDLRGRLIALIEAKTGE